jgi:hypothetical protein
MNEITFDINKDTRQDVNVFLSPYDDKSPRILKVAFTNEGIIMDFYEDAELSNTIGMTYDEWFEFSNSRITRTSGMNQSSLPKHRRR